MASEPTVAVQAAPAIPAMDAHGLTHVGRVRQTNEDAFLIGRLEHALVVQSTSLPPSAQPMVSSGVAGALFVVADGMGGQGGGDVASRVGVATVVEYLLSRMPWLGHTETYRAPESASLPGVRTALDHAVQAGDQRVRQAGAGSANPEMGTTLTLAYVLWPRLYVAHVGDSRCYVLRDGAAHQLTRDHNMAEQVRAISGQPVPEDSPMQNVVWNSLGAGSDASPEVARYVLSPGDTLLLCTDGLTKHVSDADLTTVAAAAASAAQAAEQLIQAALHGGGSDNVTVVIARFSGR